VVKRIMTALALVAALLVPSTALAAPRFTGLTYETTTTFPDGSGTQTTATVADLHFERNQFGEVCAVFNVTVHGSFQYWTGAEFVTMTQDPPAQRQQTCSSPEGMRLALADALDCTAGTFNLTGWTTHAPYIIFRGSDGSTLFGGTTLEPLVLTAITAEQREAICDLEARLTRLPDRRLVAELNKLLALFSAT
jgi:hypothetical protein